MRNRIPEGRVPEADRVAVRVEDLQVGMILLSPVGRFAGEVRSRPEPLRITGEDYVRVTVVDPVKKALQRRKTYNTRGLDDPSVSRDETYPAGTVLSVWHESQEAN
jgi:hypothetical protein